MADNVDFQSATPATPPAATKTATIETTSDGHVQRVAVGGGSTTSVTPVGDSATSVTVLASNADRLGATLYNNSTSPANVKYGATASSTSFSVRMGPGSYLEIPAGYRGVIDAIWDTDDGGNMLVTEFT